MGGSIFGFQSLTLFLPIDRCRSVTVSAHLTAGLTNHHQGISGSGHRVTVLTERLPVTLLLPYRHGIRVAGIYSHPAWPARTVPYGNRRKMASYRTRTRTRTE